LKEDGSLPTIGHANGVYDEDAEGLEGKPSLLELPEAVPEDVGPVANAIIRELKSTEVPLWMEFQEAIFRPKGGKKRQAVGLSLTPLTPQGKQLLMRVKMLSPYVAERMLSWLRSFSDERLQLAAVKVANAEFDDLFSSSLEGEEDSQSEVLDWAETEA